MNENVIVPVEPLDENNVLQEENTISVFDTEGVDSIINDIERQYEVQTGSIALQEESDANESIGLQNNENQIDEVISIISRMENSFNSANDGIVDETSRFSGAEWFDKIGDAGNILIAGIGGIGSWLSLLISRLHPENMTLFDPDTIESANLSGQLFRAGDVGEYKVHSILNTIINYSNYHRTSVFSQRYTCNLYGSNVMMCGFDNMKARRDFFKTWSERVKLLQPESKRKCLFMDGRLGLEEFQVFSIRGDEENNIKRYMDEYLFDDSEAEQIPCSMKQTSFMASMIGSIMTNIFVNFLTDQECDIDQRTFPFLTMYDAQSMRLQIRY